MQEENERRIRAMQEEIDSLKEFIRHLDPATIPVPSASQNSPAESRESPPFRGLSREHLSGQDSSYPLFVQGSSTDPTSYQSGGMLDSTANTDDSPAYTRKRTTSPSSDDDESSEYDEPSNASRPTKRINGHDTRCLTIQVRKLTSLPGVFLPTPRPFE